MSRRIPTALEVMKTETRTRHWDWPISSGANTTACGLSTTGMVRDWSEPINIDCTTCLVEWVARTLRSCTEEDSAIHGNDPCPDCMPDLDA